MKNKTWNKWNNKEDGVLKNKHGVLSANEIHNLLPQHSVRSIYHRLYHLDLYSPNFQKWTNQEKNILKKFWKLGTNEVMKRLPGRNRNIIDGYARAVLKLKRNVQHLKARNDWFPIGGKVTNNLSKSQIGYLAGIFDGEGHINVQSKPGNYLTVTIDIVTTCPYLPQWFLKNMPRHFNVYTRHPKIARYKTQYHITLRGPRRAISFLQELYPLLIIKKKEAKMLIGGYWHLSAQQKTALCKEIKRVRHIRETGSNKQ